MIHQFKFEDSNILMDIHSGSVHIVDEVTYAIASKAEILNRALGTDYNGEQRTIDMATQENVEALEIGILNMKELMEKYR